MGDNTNEPFEHNPRIDELHDQLEEIDERRVAAIEKYRAQAKKITAERNHLMMVDQLTLRILNASPLSTQETVWIEENPDEWKKIKEATYGKRGSRRSQQTSVK